MRIAKVRAHLPRLRAEGIPAALIDHSTASRLVPRFRLPTPCRNGLVSGGARTFAGTDRVRVRVRDVGYGAASAMRSSTAKPSLHRTTTGVPASIQRETVPPTFVGS